MVQRLQRLGRILFERQYKLDDDPVVVVIGCRRRLPGGYLIETCADQPSGVAGYVGGWGEEAADFLEDYADIAGCWITGEEPSQAANRITLHATGRDASGSAFSTSAARSPTLTIRAR